MIRTKIRELIAALKARLLWQKRRSDVSGRRPADQISAYPETDAEPSAPESDRETEPEQHRRWADVQREREK